MNEFLRVAHDAVTLDEILKFVQWHIRHQSHDSTVSLNLYGNACFQDLI